MESPWEVARREAWEEIGLPAMNDQLPDGFTLEALCMLPCSLARTGVVVRPCIAFLQDAGASAGHGTEDQLVPKLDAREVAAVFSAPFHGFLSRKCARTISPMVQEQWYNGNWTEWHGRRWRNHSFQVPLDSQKVTKPRDSISRSQEHDLEKTEKAETENLVYRVWGMTARILIDAARIAYGEEPDFDVSQHDPLLPKNSHSKTQ